METPVLAAPQVPDPANAPPVRWGILGPGWVAGSFASSLAGTRQHVAAAGSRSRERAEAFCARHGGTAYGSYEELVAAPDVDVVYVASPHSAHRDHALLALEAGKPVLVEKAFTRNAAEAQEVLDTAGERGLFVMEAMWSRFLPHYDVIRRTVASGVLGELVTVQADHGQALHPEGPRRLSDPALAGGALLDLGIYPLSFASMLLGDLDVTAVGTLTEEGVDAQTTIAGRSATGAHAVLTTTMTARTPTRATVCGTANRIEVDGDFYVPSTLRLVGRDDVVLDRFDAGAGEQHGGMRHQAAEVARCLDAGLTESPLMPHEETLRVMALMDEVRRQIGVIYPGE